MTDNFPEMLLQESKRHDEAKARYAKKIAEEIAELNAKHAAEKAEKEKATVRLLMCVCKRICQL